MQPEHLTGVYILAIVAVSLLLFSLLNYLKRKQAIEVLNNFSKDKIEVNEEEQEQRQLEAINDFVYECSGHLHTRLRYIAPNSYRYVDEGASPNYTNFEYANDGSLELHLSVISARITVNGETVTVVHGKEGDLIKVFCIDTDEDKCVVIGFRPDGKPYIHQDTLSQVPYDYIYGIKVSQIREAVTKNPNDSLILNLVSECKLEFTASTIESLAIISRKKENNTGEELIMKLLINNGDDVVIPLQNIEKGVLPGGVRFTAADNLAYGYFQSLN